MFGKIRKIFLQKKALTVILAALAVVGWAFAIYFGIVIKGSEANPSGCSQKLAKVRAYSELLDESNKLARQEKGLEVLEADVRALNNGTLSAVWQNVVLGGNKEQDLNDYFDTILDSIMLFSK
jgi:hypothetical protein